VSIYSKLSFFSADDNITVNAHTTNTIQADGSVVVGSGSIAASTAISDSSVKEDETAVYNAIKQFITANATVTLPPSGAIAGVYARVDNARGVWKAPANVSVNNVLGLAVNITNDLNDGLNIDATTGKSVKKATAHFVFEPNDVNTWVKVRSMIENFLTLQWRAGALAGATAKEAFYVKVGLNQTRSAQDILNGYLIVEIGMAAVRPAEFIVLRFSHKMQES
jgi:phage tail sheath protein FI